MSLDLVNVAKHAHPVFADTVHSLGPDALVALEVFSELDDLDQALVILHMGRWFALMFELAVRWTAETPCFAAQCGHPRHQGVCTECECDR